MPQIASIRMCKLSIFLFALCTNLLAPLILPICADFDLRLQDGGLLFLVFYAGHFVACVFCGKLLSVWGKRQALGCSLAALTVLCGLLTVAPNFPIVCVILFVMGFVALLIQVSATSIPSELSADGSASTVSGVQAFSALGACGGLLWSGALMMCGVSWRVSYLLFALLTAGTTFVFWRTQFPSLPKQQGGSARDIFAILRTRAFYPTFICLFLYAGAEGSICSWLVSYLVREQSFSSFSGAAVTGVLWLALFVGRIFCGRLVRRVPTRRILLTLLPLSALCVCLIPLASGAVIWLLAILLGLSLSGIWPLVASKLLDTPGHDGATAFSLAFLFSFLGNSVMPYLIGAVAEHSSLSLAILADGGVFALAFLVFFRFRKVAA